MTPAPKFKILPKIVKLLKCHSHTKGRVFFALNPIKPPTIPLKPNLDVFLGFLVTFVD
jgi:hypothetical protein